MLRSLLFYRHINLAVVLGVAVAGTCLTGALMVGDSVRHSLRTLTYERLGGIQYAAAQPYLLGKEPAEALRGNPAVTAGNAVVSELLTVRGGAATQTARAARVAIHGVDGAFRTFFDTPQAGRLPDLLRRVPSQIFPSVVINHGLAEELGVTVGGELVLRFAEYSAVHRDSLYGRKNTDDVVRQLRVTVREVLTDEDLGRFSLAPSTQVPFNAFVSLSDLQRALGRRDGVNTLLVGGAGHPTHLEQAALEDALGQSLRLEDLNLTIQADADEAALATPSYFFNPATAEAVEAIAARLGYRLTSLSTYLANSIEAGTRYVPYSLMTGMDAAVPPSDMEGRFPTKAGEAAVNRWTADQLAIGLGDALSVKYFVLGAEDALEETVVDLKVVGILPMEGLGGDRDLTPTFPGAEEADNMGDWDPTFPMDMGRIRAEDEAYWDTYRTAPKLFVTQQQAQDMWASRFGFFTGFRLTPGAGQALDMPSLRRELAEGIGLDGAGMTLLNLRTAGESASSGATDFTGLFLALSFFIILSACLLIALFFRLLVVGRADEAGLLAALGYTAARVRRRFLAEGLVLAAIGGVLGALGGTGYAALVMFGLRHYWDLGTSRLYFVFQPQTMVLGALLSLPAALPAVWLSLRVLRHISPVGLMARETYAPTRAGRGKHAVWPLAAAAVTIVCGVFTALQPTSVALGFATGTGLFVTGLGLLGRYLHQPGGELPSSLWGLAARNTARQAGRSLVCVSLVACAVYTLVAVGLFRNAGHVDTDDPHSGAGGFFLSAEAEIPLYRPLAADQAQALGLGDAADRALTDVQTVSLRLRPGDDASCLNLFAPANPRILGLGDADAFQGRFSWQSHVAEDDKDPWQLLEEPTDDGAIPVIGDYNSVMWILRSGLNKTLTVMDGSGKPATLRFVGLLKGSIFQSELIISEEAFQRLYPDQGGYGYFLFDSRDADRDTLSNLLETDLALYGFDATHTAARIQAFHEIENTYISIFQMLGGLGLLLGTLGLGAVIYRNALERRGELAAMRAFGFRRNLLARLLLAENALLVLWGMVIGAVGAVVSMLPHLLTAQVQTSWLLLGGTLVGVFGVGMLATWWAVYKAVRFPLLESLRNAS